MRKIEGTARLLCLCAAFSMPVAAVAQTPGAAAAAQPVAAGPTLKPELAPLSFFIGRWSCSGEFTASKKPISSHISVVPDLDGALIAFRWDDNPPNQFHALELWGFDKTGKKFQNSIHDNFGGLRLFDSPGWEGETLTWTGDRLAAPADPGQRFVIERKSATEFVISWQVRKAGADWTTGDRLSCRR